MTSRVIISITIASLYLLVFLVFVGFQNSTAAAWMFFFSPLVIGTMAYMIVRYGQYTGSELKPDEEWGYEDKDRSKLGLFW